MILKVSYKDTNKTARICRLIWTFAVKAHFHISRIIEALPGEQGNKAIYFRGTREQKSKTEGNRGTKAILGNKEHRKSNILILRNKGKCRFFFSGELGNRCPHPYGKASYFFFTNLSWNQINSEFTPNIRNTNPWINFTTCIIKSSDRLLPVHIYRLIYPGSR